jgi:hypothetical protein
MEFVAVVEAREDAKGRLGTLHEAMRLLRSRDKAASCLVAPAVEGAVASPPEPRRGSKAAVVR